jgi:putative ABC transport system permease protein
MEETFFDRVGWEQGPRRGLVFLQEAWSLAWCGVAARLGSSTVRGAVTGLDDDLRFAVRSLARSPAFSVGAVVMLSLGIGATNCMFSMNTGMSRVAERFQDPDELVVVWGTRPGVRRTSIRDRDLDPWIVEPGLFEEMGYYASREAYVGGGEEPLKTVEVQASVGLLPMLGIEPEVGRGLAPSDADAAAEPVALVSWRFWQERLAGDPDALGRILVLDEVAHTVIGVLPRKLDSGHPWEGVGAFTPVRPVVETPEGSPGQAERTWRVMARLDDGSSPDQVQARLSALVERSSADRPEDERLAGVWVQPLRDYLYSPQDRMAVWSIILAAVAVLLIACVNLANLLLARGVTRQSEMAVRMAVGASRWQIVRRLLVECFLLAFLGGVAGIYLGSWGMRIMLSSFTTSPFMAEEVAIDPTLLLFTLTVASLAALTFGLTPALLTSNISLGESMKEGSTSTTSSAGRRRFRQGILVAQLALVVPLVVTCVVAFRHVRTLQHVDFGLETERMLTVRVDLPPTRYAAPEEQSDFYQRLLEAMETVPGVEAVGAGVDVPIGAYAFTQLGPLLVEGRDAEEGAARGVGGYKVVTPGFFRALGASFARGRAPGPQDGTHDPLVAVVNEAFADRYWPDEEPVGKRLYTEASRSATFSSYLEGRGWTPGRAITVVGVVRDFGATFYGDPPSPTVYLPHAQHPTPSMVLVVRTEGDPLSLIPTLREVVRRVGPEVPLTRLLTGEGLVADWLRESRSIAATLGLVGVLALVLAVVGLYGMVSYTVGRRTPELGVRMALGAGAWAIRMSVMRSFLVLGSVGVALGLVLSALGATAMRSQLTMLRTPVLSTALVITVVLMAVVAVASYVPARRATRIEPVRALREA